MLDLSCLEEPVFLVSKEKVLRNLCRMSARAHRWNVRLRPHVKTHQSADIAEWLQDEGITGITVSSVGMAEYFSRHGWRDITVAVPVNIHQIPRIDRLAEKISLNVITDSEETSQLLSSRMKNPVKVWIEIDTGYHRTGIDQDNRKRLHRIAEIITASPKAELGGILTHAGHSYHAASREEILAIHKATTGIMAELKKELLSFGFEKIQASIGDTPTMSIAGELPPEIDEIRPGNFVFYDLKQESLGACREEDIAAAVACPVISISEERGELTLYGGAIHLGKEFLADVSGRSVFGRIARPRKDRAGWEASLPGAEVVDVSQEHGKVRADASFIRSVSIGDILILLPVHACLTAHLYPRYYLDDGRILRRYLVE